MELMGWTETELRLTRRRFTGKAGFRSRQLNLDRTLVGVHLLEMDVTLKMEPIVVEAKIL